MAKWRCKVCGEIITDEAMTQCPVCKAGKDKWEEVVEGAGRVWATEHKVGEGLACGDEEIIKGSNGCITKVLENNRKKTGRLCMGKYR